MQLICLNYIIYLKIKTLNVIVIIVNKRHQNNLQCIVCMCLPAIACPLILVTTLLLVVKHSATLNVFTGLELNVVWLSLTIVTLLFDCDITEIFCWVYSILGGFISETIDDCCWGKQFIFTVEDEEGKTVLHSLAKV